jgi:hypothetical protein
MTQERLSKAVTKILIVLLLFEAGLWVAASLRAGHALTWRELNNQARPGSSHRPAARASEDRRWWI